MRAVGKMARVVLVVGLFATAAPVAQAQITWSTEKVIFSSPTPANGPVWSSQYSPWVMREPGWASYVMFYCKNTVLNSVGADRIFRAESWTDGKGDFINDVPVMDGSGNATNPNYMSCSPGVTVDTAGKWHMFFVGAPQSQSGLPLRVLYATSTNYGWNWTAPQIVSAIPAENIDPGGTETPSPIFMSSTNQIQLYYVGGSNHDLYRVTLGLNGAPLAGPTKLTGAPAQVSHGRVSFANGRYYYTYSKCVGCSDFHNPPNALYIATSTDGSSFTNATEVKRSSGTTWDSAHMWSPHLLMEGSSAKLYYAGNNVTPSGFWGGYGSIGVLSGAESCANIQLTGPSSKSIYAGQAAVLSVFATSPGSSITGYQWYRGTSGNTASSIAGATGASYNTGVLSATATYWVRVRNACGLVKDSATATVSVSGWPRNGFRTFYGRWVGAVNGGGAGVDAVSLSAGTSQKWQLVDMNGGSLMSGDQVRLRTSSGTYYMVAEGCGGGVVNANRTVPGPWETFTIKKISPSTYAVLTGVILPGDSIALQANPQCGVGTFYVVAEGGGGGAVNANRTVPREWETFVIAGYAQ